MSQPYKVCPQCKQPAALDLQTCLRCGHLYRTQFVPPTQQTQMFVPPPIQPYPPVFNAGQRGISVPPGSHSPVIAVLLSLLLLICAGQFYNRQYAKGLVILGGSIVIVVLTAGLALIIVWPVALFDAGMIASRLNRGEVITEWQFF
jgi:hypothetical protein